MAFLLERNSGLWAGAYDKDTTTSPQSSSKICDKKKTKLHSSDCVITSHAKFSEPLSLVKDLVQRFRRVVLSECVVKYSKMSRKKRRIKSEEKPKNEV